MLALVGDTALARHREPNSSYAARRALLRAQLDGPLVLFGFTGREDASPAYVFAQEEYFYYLTGHNEIGAAVLLIPDAAPAGGKSWDGPREILFLEPRNRGMEQWNGPRTGPDDSDVRDKTGFADAKPFDQLRGELDKAVRAYPAIYTLTPPRNDAGYPHARNWMNWLYQQLPQGNFKDARPVINALRQVKSATELEMLGHAIELSIDAHLEAMKMMRPGIYEYEVAAKMQYVHMAGGCEREGYAPIVGSGVFSTVLHYDTNDKKIDDGDVVVLDVAGEYGGYSADITRTLPANGKFTPRQREIYEVVLGAQAAAIAAIKPGARMADLTKIVRDFMTSSKVKDKNGQALTRYFIHGLSHHIGLNVHDPGDTNRALEPGMVITMEPGIYIPEEKIGVRIEDDVLVTPTGCKVLSARLPKTVEEIDKIMADAKHSRPRASGSAENLSLRHLEVPDYPLLGVHARLQGEVEVSFDVSPQGEVVNATARTGHALLREETLKNLGKWSYEPLGVPTKGQSVTYEYKLFGQPRDYRSPTRVEIEFGAERLPLRLAISTTPLIPQPSKSTR